MPARRTIVATLAAVALIAPAASQAEPPDMHASTALAAAKARATEQPEQDLRSPDARDAVTPRPEPRVPAGQPTWPVHPVPLVVHAQAPASSHDDGSPITLIALIAGGLVALTGVFAARHAVRRDGRHPRVAV